MGRTAINQARAHFPYEELHIVQRHCSGEDVRDVSSGGDELERVNKEARAGGKEDLLLHR